MDEFIRYFTNHPEIHMLGHVILAAFLGGIIGGDREISNKPAGFRTHVLVASSACTLVLIGNTLTKAFAAGINHQVINADPNRIIGAVITGISFLGAGTIIRQNEKDVTGMTTAASLLLTASVGLAVSVGLYYFSISLTLFTIAILRIMGQVKKKLKH